MSNKNDIRKKKEKKISDKRTFTVMSSCSACRRLGSRDLQCLAHTRANLACATTGRQLNALHNMWRANSKYSLFPNIGISKTMRNTFNKLSILSQRTMRNTLKSNSMSSAKVTSALTRADSNTSPN